MSEMLRSALRRAIVQARAPGSVRFTERQLYYELCRVLQPWHALPRRPGFRLRALLRYERFRALLAECPDVTGLLPVQAVEPVQSVEPVQPVEPVPIARHVPDEVFAYGLPRLLVCHDASIAAMLLANDLHLESACPVFPASGLPLDERLRPALANGTVYVLHDCGAAGIACVAAVREWAGELRVRSLGLRDEHAAALHLPKPPAAGLPTAGLPAAGLAATAMCTAEVAAVNPARLLRTVHRLVRGFGRVRPRAGLRQLQRTGFLSWPTS